MTTKKFKTVKDFNDAIEVVYNFHRMCYNTILSYLQKNGDIIIDDEEKERDFNFEFLEYEGNYLVDAIRLTEDKNDFYLDCTSESGDSYYIDWNDINQDMVIEQMIMNKIFPEQ